MTRLIGAAGLVPVMRLAERAGPHELLGEHVSGMTRVFAQGLGEVVS